MVDLVQAGFDFVMFDSDVFLTSTSHPLAYMNEYSDLSWDIQFQLDHPNGRVNIGWFWARPSQPTIDHFIRSRQQWKTKGGWDQAVMNNVLSKIKATHKRLSSKLLNAKKFVNFMDTHWYRTLSLQTKDHKDFYDIDEQIRYQMIKNASDNTVMWHYTCVEKFLKIFIAKYYGQWTNLDEYYTKIRQFLLPINLGHQNSNNTKILLTQFLIAIKLALISGRTLVFPDTVARYPFRNFPSIRAFSMREIHLLGIDYVEPSFFFHRKVKHNIDMPDESIVHLSATDRSTLVKQLIGLIDKLDGKLKSKELVKLDFSKFNSIDELTKIKNFDQWWSKSIITNGEQTMNISSIRLCRNIERNQKALCLKICT